MEEDKILLPDGWTYYAHRTNTERWDENPFDLKTITIKKIMSVVTESEVYQEINHYGKNHFQGYNTGSGEPFEIRCLICDMQHVREMDDSNELKKVMTSEFYFDRRNFGGCYGQRHHSIPPKEELIVLGIGEYDEAFEKEKKIIWTIPRRFIEYYKEELQKVNNREIGLKSPVEEKHL
jgi:hypothetical protein